MRSRHFMTSLFFIWSHFTFFFRSYFNDNASFQQKEEISMVKSDYVPLPEAKETLIPSFPDIRYILRCDFYNELAIICDFC